MQIGRVLRILEVEPLEWPAPIEPAKTAEPATAPVCVPEEVEDLHEHARS